MVNADPGMVTAGAQGNFTEHIADGMTDLIASCSRFFRGDFVGRGAVMQGWSSRAAGDGNTAAGINEETE